MKLLLCLLVSVALVLCGNEARQTECEPNWVGSDCSIYSQAVEASTNYTGAVDTTKWKFYYVNLVEDSVLTATLTQSLPDPECDLDMYVQKDTFPAFDNYLLRDISVETVSTLSVGHGLGTYFFGVYGYYGCEFTFSYVVGDACDCGDNGECVNGVCECNEGWTDETCSTSYIVSPSGQQNAKTNAFGWFNYAIDIEEQPLNVLFELMLGGEGNDSHEADLYVAADRVPTMWNYDYRTPGGGEETNFQVSVAQPMANTRYYFSVNCRENATYFVTATIFPRGADCINQCSNHGTCNGGECQCNEGFSGLSCERMDSNLVMDTPVSGLVTQSAWNFYFSNFNSATPVDVHIIQTSPTADCDLYVKRGNPPNFFNYDYSDFSTNVAEFTTTIPSPGSEVWYMGVYGYTDCEYTIQVSESVECACGAGGFGSCGVGSPICVCQPGWGGEGCTIRIADLQNGVVARGLSLAPRTWSIFTISVPKSIGLTVAVKETSSVGYIWVYVKVGSQAPTLSDYDFSSRSTNEAIHQIDVTQSFSDTAVTIGVYANPYASSDVGFEIVSWYVPF